MVVSIKVKTNAKQLSRKQKALARKFPNIIKMALNQASEDLLDKIRTRTEKGFGVKGKQKVRFPPYSVGYQAKLKKLKKNPLKIVDLFLTGSMLGSLKSKTFKDRAIVFVGSDQKVKALGHQKGLGKLPQRRFLDYTRLEKKAIINNFHKTIKEELKRTRL